MMDKKRVSESLRSAGTLNKLQQIQLILLGVACCAIIKTDAICDRIFSPSKKQSSLFEAPSRVDIRSIKMASDAILGISSGSGDNSTINSTLASFKPMHCLYKFVAQEGDHVALNFTSFKMRGDEPECAREYVDIYVNLKSDQGIESMIANEPPNGRFCTSIVPRKIISLHNMIVLSIYTELPPPVNQRPLFEGVYEFIKSKVVDQIGAPAAGTLCTHTIYSKNKREGEFQTLTYPGVYVKNMSCSYKFVGESGQRIRLEFLDLDVYSGGSHCPLDIIKVFDGLEETDPIINTICGSHRSLIIYSTREHMFVTFTTSQRESEIQNRGFSAYFEFSDKFYDVNFILGQNAKHIRGSECDQRIFSQKRTTGLIVAPESRYNHSNAICRYIFEGLQNSIDYEKVSLKFLEFDLKIPRNSGTTQSTITAQQLTTTNASNLTEPTNVGGINTSTEQCPDNYVRIYTSELKPDQKQDPNDYDYMFCSNEIPPTIESDAASMLMEYNSGSIGGHFKAEYEFIVDFRVPGIQATSGCTYSYRSDNLKTGTFNSPRHPSWYMNDMNCTYTFQTKSDEALLLQFTSFKMANSFNEKIGGYNEACANEDRVEIVELKHDVSEHKSNPQDHYVIGTYCGTTKPGPILSFHPVRIKFETNRAQVHYGFAAVYYFYRITELQTNDFVTNCGGNLHASQRLKTGSFSSPPTYRSETYEKRNHICTWNITARPAHKIAIDFSKFELEGSPSVRGCATAAVRLNFGSSKLPTELCGTISPTNTTTHQFVSEHEWISVTFMSTKHASGSNGFTAIWTEVK